MELSPEQQQAMEAQKAQCPFCKIVKGEIPSKKVYEDDLLLGILDINPAAKGHILLMPKEHYPIMPLIPPDTFIHLFEKTKLLSNSLKQGLLLFGDTIYIANGYAAGQQSSHFMLHVIPREDMDGLDFFTPKKKDLDQTKRDEALKLLKHNLPIMLRNRYKLFSLEGKPSVVPEQGAAPAASSASSAAVAQPQQRQYTKESLIALIESNPQLKQLVTQFPDDFKKQVASNERLQELFAQIDLDTIITHFAPPEPVAPASEGQAATQGGDGSSQEEGEAQYTMDELVDIVNDNPKLRELLLKQTYLFAEKIQQIPELKKIFGHVDIEELERAVLRKDVQQEQDVSDIVGDYVQKLGPHLDVPSSGNPAPIQEEDPSVAKLHEQQQDEGTQEQDEAPASAETQEPENQDSQEEPEQQEKKPEEDGEDLISKIHGELLRGGN